MSPDVQAHWMRRNVQIYSDDVHGCIYHICYHERERERERQTDRQTDRQTEREREGEKVCKCEV